MADNHFDLVIVWDNLGGAVRVNAGGRAAVTDPTTDAAVTVVQDGASVTTVTADSNGRVSFVAQQGLVKLTSGGLSMVAVSAEQATAGAANAAAAQAAQTAAEAARDTAQGYAQGLVVRAVDYGVVGDGLTDDTTGLQNALNAASTSGTFGVRGVVILKPGRYLTTGLTIPEGVTLRGAGKGVSTIVQSTSPQLLIQIRGSQTAGVTTLTANAVPGATTLTLASTSSLSAGGIIALHDTVSYNPNDATYKSGEQLRIKSVDSSTQVTIYGVVRGSWATSDGSYTTANGAQITKLNMIDGGGIADLSIEGDPATLTTLFFAQYVDRPTVTNVDVTQGGNPGIRFDGCRDVAVAGYTCRDLVDDTANSHVGYGILLTGPNENVTVTGGAIARVRHAITTGASAYGMSHNVVVDGLVVTECTNSGLDTHAAGENILFSDCIVVGCLNGVNIRSRSTHVKGGLFELNTSHGVNFNETLCKDVSVQGATIRRSGAYGIVAAYPVDGLVVLDNVLQKTFNHCIVVDSGSARVKVGRNVLLDYGTGASGRVGVFSNTTNGGTPATGGWDVFDNLIGQTAVTTAANAINSASAGLTGARVYGNRAYGTFSGTVFNTNGLSSRNVKVDAAAPSITGSRGGNAALAALLTQLAAQGLITDGTSA